MSEINLEELESQLSDTTLDGGQVSEPVPESEDPVAPQVTTPEVKPVAPVLDPVAEPVKPALQAPQVDTTFLGTYKTKEAAEAGLREKDQAIDRMRTAIMASTGIDPLTGKPASQAQPEASPIDTWSKDKDAYFNEYVKNPVSVQQKLFQHQMNQYAPLFRSVATLQAKIAVQEFGSATNAEGKLVNEGFNDFVKGGGLAKSFQENPVLMQNFEYVMDTYQFDKLPHVLAMAFASHKAAQAPAVAQKVAEETRNQVTKEINENKKAFAEKSKPSAPVNKKESLADLEARLADVKF